jgi:hypothetical protein
VASERYRQPKAWRLPAYLRVAEREVIKAIWLAAEEPCGKPLKAALKVWLPHYEKRRGRLAAGLRQRVMAISASSIDRLLAPCRASQGARDLARGRGVAICESDSAEAIRLDRADLPRGFAPAAPNVSPT